MVPCFEICIESPAIGAFLKGAIDQQFFVVDVVVLPRSWATPRNPQRDPGDHRQAIHPHSQGEKFIAENLKFWPPSRTSKFPPSKSAQVRLTQKGQHAPHSPQLALESPAAIFLQIGLGGTLGLGLCDLLRARAVAAPTSPAAKNVNCIMIWMDGGPSHYETFDPKPDAPAEIRGTFGTIPTASPGCTSSETIPNLARRSTNSPPSARSATRTRTRRRQSLHDDRCAHARARRLRRLRHLHPSFGSMVSYDRGVRSGLPA